MNFQFIVHQYLASSDDKWPARVVTYKQLPFESLLSFSERIFSNPRYDYIQISEYEMKIIDKSNNHDIALIEQTFEG